MTAPDLRSRLTAEVAALRARLAVIEPLLALPDETLAIVSIGGVRAARSVPRTYRTKTSAEPAPGTVAGRALAAIRASPGIPSTDLGSARVRSQALLTLMRRGLVRREGRGGNAKYGDVFRYFPADPADNATPGSR